MADLPFRMALARLNNYKDWMNVQNALGIVLIEAQKRCPVDTGYLKSHWMIKRERGGVWSIVFTAPYATYVHERLDVRHRVGEAKFLENAWTAKRHEFVKQLYGF